jgi:NitT/TauT family transport system ATP-binding protein
LIEEIAAMALGEGNELLDVRGVRQSFRKPSGGDLSVLEDVNLSLREGEIVGLLGRSGSGKSTLLRLIAGLNRPTGGAIVYHGAPLHGPARGIAMVFQSFALFPWLTVLENVELGLEALGTPEREMRKRALAAIDLIGLDGFESAYPKELSGGMRQRVGFARAIVVHPDILLMDEPFSALDILTAETLRGDFLDLWCEGQMPIKSVLLVTHNIEEAVLMCDRILVFASNPGRVAQEIAIDLPPPRNRADVAFRKKVDMIYVAMTEKSGETGRRTHVERFPGTGIATVLPRVSTNVLAGLMEAVAAPPYNGRADLPVIASTLNMEIDAHYLHRALGHMKEACDIGGDVGSVVVMRIGDERLGYEHAGVVDQRIDAAEAIQRLLEDQSRRVRVSDIPLHRHEVLITTWFDRSGSGNDTVVAIPKRLN